VPCAEKEGELGPNGLKAGHRLSEDVPAAPHCRGEAHAIEETRRSGLWGVTVAVGIEPESRTTCRAKATDSADSCVAVAAEHKGEVSDRSGGAHGMSKTPGQFERSANLGRVMGRVVFQNLDGSDLMPEALEVAGEPGP
jgi:hypothetical protein